jgi:hypothetical protein
MIMTFLLPLIPALIGGVASAAASKLLSPKKSAAAAAAPPTIHQLRPATRDDAREGIERDNELRRRRGGAADIITGRRGAEAAAGSTGKLVLGS